MSDQKGTECHALKKRAVDDLRAQIEDLEKEKAEAMAMIEKNYEKTLEDLERNIELLRKYNEVLYDERLRALRERIILEGMSLDKKKGRKRPDRKFLGRRCKCL